ncbi:Mitochondrial import receptor subunit tom40 [Penicillium chermesinum]|nr:Mitochondrial import receptor subunit tom40 [Penicillium chermesinum]
MSDFSSSLSLFTENPAAAVIKDAFNSFSERRAQLNLPNPGTVDNLAREVQKEVMLTNFMFSGIRADLTKVFGMSPLFRVFMQGNLGNDGNLAAVGDYRWNQALVTKANAQIMSGSQQGLLQLDNDYTGADFSASLKAFNPSCLEGGLTGIFVGSYLQSITPGLALGFEAIWQRQYKGDNWIGTAQLQAQGTFSATYWRRLSERVEAGVDMNLTFAPSAAAMMMGGPSREGTTAIGAKYDFRASSRIAMPISLTFAGEIDQVKQTAKVGMAVSLEIAGEELMEQQESMDATNMVPPPF